MKSAYEYEPVTVVAADGALYYTVVTQADLVAFVASGHPYMLIRADEGVTWLHGHVPPHSQEAAALISAYALRAEDT